MDDEGGPVTVSYGRRESFVLADDMSDFFGTQRSIDGTLSSSITACISACLQLTVPCCTTPCTVMPPTMLRTHAISTGVG